MDYEIEHKKLCAELLERALLHIESTGMGKTYLCRRAGVQIHALKALESGSATPKTMQGLSDFLDEVGAAQ